MSLANKIYKNNSTGEIVKIMDSFENIAITENMKKIDVRDLSNVSLYTEQIDPENFFNTQNAYTDIFDKIKNIPTDGMIDDSNISGIGGTLQPHSNESAIIMSSEDEERAELARKYGADLSLNETNHKPFSSNINEDDYIMPTNNRPIQSEDNQVTRVEVNRDYIENKYNDSLVEDPIISMFRKTKRNNSFSVNLKIEEKIPRVDFIEMMEDSYETSIIEFLANEFTNNILNDPRFIKDLIKDEISKLVYGEDFKKKMEIIASEKLVLDGEEDTIKEDIIENDYIESIEIEVVDDIEDLKIKYEDYLELNEDEDIDNNNENNIKE